MRRKHVKRLTIGELAKRAGVGVETVRFYQRKGLLVEPPRQSRGFRVYPDEALEVLRFIRRVKGLGFTLSEIRELIALRKARRDTTRELIEALETKGKELADKAQELEVTRQGLARIVEEMRGAPPDERWGLMDPNRLPDT